MRIYTCALLPFEANAAFFTRDSGLLCRSIQNLGVDSKVVLPSASMVDHDDPDDVIRAPKGKFDDVEWWRLLNIDAVVFISWGFAEHTKILTAAKQAGIKVVVIFDTSGGTFPLMAFTETIKMWWRRGAHIQNVFSKSIGVFVRSLWFGIKGVASAYHQTVQLLLADCVFFPSPIAARDYMSVLSFFSWVRSDRPKINIGYPSSGVGHYCNSSKKERKVVAIARWDAIRHKRPQILSKVLEKLLECDEEIVVDVYGKKAPFFEGWWKQLPDSSKQRITLHGILPNQKVRASVMASQVLYCPSACEAGPVPVFEALCMGSSVVGLKTTLLPCVAWAAEENAGNVAVDDSVGAHVRAIRDELAFWMAGKRDPLIISEKFSYYYSADRFSQRIIEWLGSIK